MILDLKKLNSNHRETIRKLSNQIQYEFNNVIDEIQIQNKKLVFSLGSISSRNNHQSDVFKNCVYAIFINNELKINPRINKILVYNRTLKKFLSKTFNNIDIVYSKSDSNYYFDFAFTPYINLIKILKNSFLYLISKDSNRIQKILTTDEIFLIDTYLIKDSINHGKYIDRYYNNILDFCSKEMREKIFFYPNYKPQFKKSLLTQIQNNSKENIVFKNDFLKLSDYFKSFFYLITQSIKLKKYKIHSLDITYLISKSFHINKFNYITFDSLLNYFFVKRLMQKKLNINTLIDWGENQSLDKALIKGFRVFSPSTKIKSYQGIFSSYDYNFHLCPTSYEINNGLIADEILVLGKTMQKKIKKFSNNLIVKTGPAFRFKKINQNLRPINRNKILIVLPIDENESINIFNFLHIIFKNLKINKKDIDFKLHPTINYNQFLSKVSLAKKYVFVEKKFSDIIGSYSLVLGNSSSALMESLLYGIPVIVVPSFSGFSRSPIPDDVDSRICRVCNNEDDISLSIEYFLNLDQNEKLKLIEISKKIELDYFAPVNFESVKQLLNN